jgi:hypothetical protein
MMNALEWIGYTGMMLLAIILFMAWKDTQD